jgi:hypothetical protein
MSDAQPDQSPGGKGRPTPSRKAREAANKRPIVVADRAEAKRQLREKERVERAKVNAGYAAGEERYLPLKDKGPQKKWVRDYVDARLSAGEFLIPVMFLVIVLLYFPIPAVQEYSTFAIIGYFALTVLDCVILGYIAQRRMRERYGERAERVRWYAAMRALQLRMMRLPKPQVKRFQFPE